MRYFFLVVLISVGVSCNNAEKSNETITETAENDIPDAILVWNVDAESMIIKRDSSVQDSHITITRVINGLNEKYPQANLLLLMQSGDTLYVEMPEATFVGEQIGSAGAAAWFADAVINLTAVAGVNYVSFRMDTHSHAQSGVIGRSEYDKWIRQ